MLFSYNSKMKRDHVLKRLSDMGLPVKVSVHMTSEEASAHVYFCSPPMFTFYIWLDLKSLPEPLSSGMTFFEE